MLYYPYCSSYSLSKTGNREKFLLFTQVSLFTLKLWSTISNEPFNIESGPFMCRCLLWMPLIPINFIGLWLLIKKWLQINVWYNSLFLIPYENPNFLYLINNAIIMVYTIVMKFILFVGRDTIIRKLVIAANPFSMMCCGITVRGRECDEKWSLVCEMSAFMHYFNFK